MTGIIASPSTEHTSFYGRIFNESNDRTRYIIIFLLVIVLRFLFHFIVFNMLKNDFNWWQSDDYDEIAGNILSGNGYVREPGLPVNTSRTPIYVYFLVGLFYMFGKNSTAIILSQSIIQAFACIVVYRLSSDVFHNRNLALLPALGLVFYPQAMLYATYLHPESIFLLFSVLSAYCYYRFWKNPTLLMGLLTGLFVGLLTLTKPIAQLLILPLLFGIVFHYRQKMISILSSAVPMFLAFIIIITPWVIRNYQVEGKFISVASRGGRFIHQATIRTNQGDLEILKSIEHEKEGSEDVNAEAQWLKIAANNILENPGLFFFNIGKNLTDFWYRGHFTTVCIVNGLINFPLLFFAIIGFIRARKRDITIAPFLLMIFYFNMVHGVTYGMARYAFPVIPFVLMFSAYGGFFIWKRRVFVENDLVSTQTGSGCAIEKADVLPEPACELDSLGGHGGSIKEVKS